MRVTLRWLPVVVAALCAAPAARPLTLDWTLVDGPGPCDPQPQGCFGAVPHAYFIATFPVTNAQYAEFLNAVAASDPLGLYDSNMGSGFGGIERTGSPGSFAYAALAGREDMPVNYVSFFDALRFANWLHNGQGGGDTETGAYTLLGGTPTPSNGDTVTRNAGARVFLTSEDEWVKAAYFDPSLGAFRDYPAGSDTPTACSAPTASANRANCEDAVGDLTPVGSYPGSAGPFGSFDQGGNVHEWNEAIVAVSARGRRGGSFAEGADLLAAATRGSNFASGEIAFTGFRVARGPDPVKGPVPGTLLSTSGGSGLLALDPATGDRTELSGPSAGGGAPFSLRPVDVVREESGDFVIADFDFASGSDVGALIRVDGDTGDRSVLATSSIGSGGPFRPGALEIDGDRRFVPANFGTLLAWNSNASAIERVDPVSGDRTLVSSASVGSGPNLSAVQDMLRFGPGPYGVPTPFDDDTIDLVVSDSSLDALVLVSSALGDRYVLSSASEGSGPAFVTPRGIAMVHEQCDFTFYVVDSGLDAVLAVDRLSGDRQIVSSSTVGVGPDLAFPIHVWPSASGGLYVADLELEAIVHVDPATGDRTLVADASTGSGPPPGGVWSLTAVPQETLALGFEQEPPGAVPACSIPFPGPPTILAVVVEADDFVGSAAAAEGSQALYLATGPGDRGLPASSAGQFDESAVILPVPRGQNAPRRLRLSVDYLTGEGSEPDPTEIYEFPPGLVPPAPPIALLSMQTANPSVPFFGGAYTALTGFAEGPITGPDGSVFGQGHVGYRSYELDVDFPGVALILRVADEGDALVDTAMLVDDLRFLPEPARAAALALGCLLLAALAVSGRSAPPQPSRGLQNSDSAAKGACTRRGRGFRSSTGRSAAP